MWRRSSSWPRARAWSCPTTRGDAALQRERAYKERLYAACRKAARFYMETLLGPDGAPGRAYLAGRGLTSEAVKRFGIGFAPASWDALKNRLTAEGFTQQELLDAGLLVHNTEKNSVYDAYRNRVIFPIIGTGGRVLGFGARVLGDEKPKYINTGDTRSTTSATTSTASTCKGPRQRRAGDGRGVHGCDRPV